MRIFYSQHCGTCGRTMRVPIDLLGQRVTCPHCNAEFTAADSTFACRTISERSMPTINERVERLLTTSSERR